MPSPRPTEVPKHRDDVLKFLKTDGRPCPCGQDHAGESHGLADVMAKMKTEGRKLDKAAIKSTSGFVDESMWKLGVLKLPAAEMFFVAQPMIDLAAAAGARLWTDFKLDPEDIPAPTGFMCLENAVEFEVAPSVTYPIGAIFWAVSPEYMWVMFFADTWDPRFKRRSPSGRYLYTGYCGIALGASIGESALDLASASVESNERVSILATIKAAWLLMTQAIGTDERVKAGRPTSGRSGRTTKRPEVRVISLRRPASADSAGSGEGREWHHRWIVRGHWRMQPWGPKRERVRPVWIAPHVKGPEDKPLIGGEKVYAWTK
jgi:hypothetical protein